MARGPSAGVETREYVVETVEIDDRGPVRVVTMARPEALNAVSFEMMDELADTFLAAAADDAVKVLVLTGTGRAFSAGADLTEMLGPPQEQRHGLDGMISAMIDFPKPFIAAVNGIGVGYGATVCGLADLTFVSTEVRLRAPFSALGLTPELASTQTFAAHMGPQRAAWFLLSAEWMDAEACVAAGIALEAVEPDQLMDRVMQHANVLGGLPLASLVATKELMAGPHRAERKATMRRENEATAKLLNGPANREAVQAFLAKREPSFEGM